MFEIDFGRNPFNLAVRVRRHLDMRAKRAVKGLTSRFDAYESVFYNVDSANAVSSTNGVCGCEDIYGVCDCFGLSIFGVLEFAGYAFLEFDGEKFLLVWSFLRIDGQFPHISRWSGLVGLMSACLLHTRYQRYETGLKWI